MTTSGSSLTAWSEEVFAGCAPAAAAGQCRANPGSPAIADGVRLVTYGELDTLSNQLASLLRDAGVQREVPVALLFDRSADFVVAALAVWKAGGAYLPLDAQSAAQRVQSILIDSGSPLIVSHRAKARELPPGPWRVIDLDVERDAINRQPPVFQPAEAQPDQLAYLIYTSGSTGRPKGVEITHANLANLVRWHVEAFDVTSEDRASQVAGLGFDAAVWEIWPYLAVGASVHFADDTVRKSPIELRDWIVSERITIGFIPTAMAEYMIALDWPANPSLRVALTGADTLHKRPPAKRPFALVNNYGPTECTVVSTSGLVSPAAGGTPLRPSIGRPILNYRIHILDDQLREVAPGEAGELCIAGAGVARGYRNLPELTRQKFVPDPFRPSERMYRSGDRARWLPGGEIEFLGRADDQVKIRGFRVEPDEIVWALNQHLCVTASAVIPRGEGDGCELAAYLVLAAGAMPTALDLQQFLGARLPDYMIPRWFVRIRQLPMNASGKCDRAALPAPDASNLLPSGSAPSFGDAAASALERELAALIAAQLGVETVGRADNFFLLGGHSMFAARLTAKLREAYGVTIPLRQLFQSPTVAKLSAEVERLRGNQV